MNTKEAITPLPQAYRNIALITGILNETSAAYQLAEGSKAIAVFNGLAGVAVLGVRRIRRPHKQGR